MNKIDFKKLKKYRRIHLIDDLDSFDENNQETGYVYINNKISNKKKFLKNLKKKIIYFYFLGNILVGYLTTLADLKAFQNIDNIYEKFKKNNLFFGYII